MSERLMKIRAQTVPLQLPTLLRLTQSGSSEHRYEAFYALMPLDVPPSSYIPKDFHIAEERNDELTKMISQEQSIEQTLNRIVAITKASVQ